MIVWIDAQLPPALAGWMRDRFGVEAIPVRDLGLRDARDQDIFFAARTAGVVVLSKDVDFVDLLLRHRPPPQVVWITCGNTSNARLREILSNAWVKAAKLLEEGEPLVEIQERVE